MWIWSCVQSKWLKHSKPQPSESGRVQRIFNYINDVNVEKILISSATKQLLRGPNIPPQVMGLNFAYLL